MLQTDFIRQYCKNSSITEKELNQLGLFAIPCDCDDKECQGWAMITRENIEGHVKTDVNKP